MITKHFKRKMDRGFSLIEMLVYIVILAFMLVLIIEVVLSVSRSERVVQSMRSVENSAVVSLERISREVRQAESVNTSLSTLSTHPGRLVLNGYDNSNNPRTVEFYLTNGRLYVSENNTEIGALSEARANIVDLKFHYFTASSSVGVRTEIKIESGTSTHYRTETFYSTALTR